MDGDMGASIGSQLDDLRLAEVEEDKRMVEDEEIPAADIEMETKLMVSMQLITKGCEQCCNSEGVCLEACRLSSPVEAKAVTVKVVKAILNSVKLWMQATKLEQDQQGERSVSQKGLEQIPNSVRLSKGFGEERPVMHLVRHLWQEAGAPHFPLFPNASSHISEPLYIGLYPRH